MTRRFQLHRPPPPAPEDSPAVQADERILAVDLQIIRANIGRLLGQLARPESLRGGDGGSLRTQALFLGQDVNLRVYIRHRDEIIALRQEANELADLVDEAYQRYRRDHA